MKNWYTSATKKIPASIPKSSRNGDCYVVSAKYVLDNHYQNNGLSLVHGIVTGQGPIRGVQYGHAWVEDGDMVIDKSNGRDLHIPKMLYYALGNISDTHRYAVEEVRKKILETKHWGPWDLKADF